MIGIFDSGVGGLAIFQSISEKLPNIPMWYVADNGFAPYGAKAEREIRDRAFHITRFLRKKGAKIIVVACHTATLAAVDYLRDVFPDTVFVGVEPPVKVAIENNPKHRIGVLTTEATAKSARFLTLVARATIPHKDVNVRTIATPELFEIVEQQKLFNIETELAIREVVGPLLEDFHMNSLVVGSTHVSFLAPLIQRVVGTYIPIFDSREEVANEVKRLYAKIQPKKSQGGTAMFYTTGSRHTLKKFLHDALAIESEVYEV